MQTYHENITQRLQVISSRLLDTQMSVDASVTSGTSQVLVLPVRNVQMGLGVSVFLGETEIDHVDLVATFADSHEEIVRFDVSVDEVSGMDVFDSGDLDYIISR